MIRHLLWIVFGLFAVLTTLSLLNSSLVTCPLIDCPGWCTTTTECSIFTP